MGKDGGYLAWSGVENGVAVLDDDVFRVLSRVLVGRVGPSVVVDGS